MNANHRMAAELLWTLDLCWEYCFLLSSHGRAFVVGVDSVICAAPRIHLPRVACFLLCRVFRRRLGKEQSYVRASIPSNPYYSGEGSQSLTISVGSWDSKAGVAELPRHSLHEEKVRERD